MTVSAENLKSKASNVTKEQEKEFLETFREAIGVMRDDTFGNILNVFLRKAYENRNCYFFFDDFRRKHSDFCNAYNPEKNTIDPKKVENCTNKIGSLLYKTIAQGRTSRA